MITATGPITLITGPRDRTIAPDPRVRYQPTTIGGRHYKPTPTTRHPRSTS